MVHQPPLFSSFKPADVRMNQLSKINLSLDELEAIRLADYLRKEHSEAAIEMDISRSTFTRIIEKARSKVASFLLEGKHLLIEGGDIHFRGNLMQCQSCGHIFKTDFEQIIEKCPACHSTFLLDLAGGFGHGKCCRGFHNHRRR
jgi:predicted DNA-binding protein (UPF0251 family)